jgi:hypothetical protein
MTEKQLEELGFLKWDDESSLMLIPVWLFNFIDPKSKLISVNGSEITGELDTDSRQGALSFGVYPSPALKENLDIVLEKK